jgi:hypothetical protein
MPDNAVIRNFVGDALRAPGRDGSRAELWHRAADLAPSWARPAHERRRGRCCGRAGQRCAGGGRCRLPRRADNLAADGAAAQRALRAPCSRTLSTVAGTQGSVGHRAVPEDAAGRA